MAFLVNKVACTFLTDVVGCADAHLGLADHVGRALGGAQTSLGLLPVTTEFGLLLHLFFLKLAELFPIYFTYLREFCFEVSRWLLLKWVHFLIFGKSHHW
jgi:hypothetical protein